MEDPMILNVIGCMLIMVVVVIVVGEYAKR